MHISEKMSVHTHVRALRQFMRCLLKVRLYILAGIFALCIVFMMQHHKDFLSPLSSVREDVEPHKQYGSNEGWTVRTRARYERDEERKARRFERRVAQEWVHQSARGPTWHKKRATEQMKRKATQTVGKRPTMCECGVFVIDEDLEIFGNEFLLHAFNSTNLTSCEAYHVSQCEQDCINKAHFLFTTNGAFTKQGPVMVGLWESFCRELHSTILPGRGPGGVALSAHMQIIKCGRKWGKSLYIAQQQLCCHSDGTWDDTCSDI